MNKQNENYFLKKFLLDAKYNTLINFLKMKSIHEFYHDKESY